MLPIRRSRRWNRPPSSEHLRLGAGGERVAARYLSRRGYRILARDFRCRTGQIDLIASYGHVVVFVEVKTRTSDASVNKLPVHPSQQDRIGRAARYFLARRKFSRRPARFDVVFITWPPDGDPLVEHVVDAFTPGRW